MRIECDFSFPAHPPEGPSGRSVRGRQPRLVQVRDRGDGGRRHRSHALRLHPQRSGLRHLHQ